MSRLAYFEIHATTPARLVEFYTSLFGWRFERCNHPREYWRIISGSGRSLGINGGLTVRAGSSPLDMQAFNAFVCIMAVDSLDLALEQVVSLGGKIVEEQKPVPDQGRLAYAQDPDGNIFGLVQADDEPASGAAHQ
jgi:predicted enzyme related to lactoylglutathione lyase